MFFKKISSLLLILSLLSSCSWLRDKPKTQKGFESGELDLSCLQNMPTQLQELFAGHYTESISDQNSVKAIWKCLDRSLNTFSKYTHGSDSTYYTDEELQEFANRYLPNDNLFSKSLVSSIFKLKTAVLGGNNQKISQGEISKLRAKLKTFGEIILPLAPYISTLLKSYDNLYDNRVQIAGVRLNKFISDLATLLGDSENTVTWLDLSSFIGELEKYLKSPHPTALTVVREQIQVFQYLKLLVVGGDELGIEKTKWQPIFKGISSIYNALYLTATSTEMMEQLAIEIQSNDEEQKKATEKLTGILKALKGDPTLYSKSTIQILADSWSKALILNAFLYPKSKNKLEIKSFLSSSLLRKLTANLMDEMAQVKAGDQSIKLIVKIAENLTTLIEETGVNQNSILNINNFREYTALLKPLFTNEKNYQIIDSSIAILQDVSAILIGNNSGNLSSIDFKILIQKATNLYSAWKDENQKDFNKSISLSLNVLIRRPNAQQISIDQIKGLLLKCEKLFSKLNLKSTIDWAQMNKTVVDGAKLKSILFSNTDQNITNYELTQIFNTWSAFNDKKEIDEVLENLAKYFKNNPFSSVKIEELMKALDAFLPEDKKLSKLGITLDLVGPLKAFLVGGQATILDRSEYSKLSQIGFTIFRSLKPVIKSLPRDFKPGLNSSTFAILEAGAQGIINDKNKLFYNEALKQLLLSQFKSSGLTVKPQTVDKLLIGLNHRIFDQNKKKKPSTYPLTFSSSKLSGIKQVLEKTKLDYQDFESAFTGVDSVHSIPGDMIYKRLTRASSKNILRSLHPIINGQTSMPYFTANGKPQTDYYLADLYYKDLIYNALMMVFPAYEVEIDNKKTDKMPRLSSNDLIDLFDDVNDAVFDLGLSFSPDSPQESAVKRMQSINLFTRTGNGDDYIDVIETVDFLTTTFAGKNLLDEVRRHLVKECYPKNISYTSQEKFSFSCLKNEFFWKNQFTNFYQKVIPLMSDHYASLEYAQREEYRKSTLTAVRAGWKENSQMNLSDLEVLVSIPYYIENIFLRLDSNYDGILNFTEAMSGFPIFCREIKKAGGKSIKGSCEAGESPRQVEAIYGHLLMKGEAPRSIQEGDSIFQKIKTAKNFLVWTYLWRTLDRDPEIRNQNPPYLHRKDLLNIISNLSTTIAPPPPPPQLLINASSG